MAMATRTKTPKFRILQTTEQEITGLVYAKVAEWIILRDYKDRSIVSEEVTTIRFDDLINLIWRGENPYDWLKSQAEFINPDCELNVEEDLFARIEEEISVYDSMVSYGEEDS